MLEEDQSSQRDTLGAQVDEAFALAESGDTSAVAALGPFGPSLLAHLQPYAGNSNPEIRAAVATLLKGLGGKMTIPLLLVLLSDQDDDVQQRAALALYENFSHHELSLDRDIGIALGDAIALGNSSASALLLAGWYDDENLRALLTQLTTGDAAGRTKLRAASPVINTALVAQVALSRMGNQNSRAHLAERIRAGDLDELRFLLEAVVHVDSPPILQSLAARTLEDRRITMSHGPAGTSNSLRLCDEAVNAYAAQFQLGLTFDGTEPRHFTDDELKKAASAIRNLTPH